MSAFLAEILGTMLLILLGNGVVANVLLDKTKGNNAGWIVITLGWGLAVFVGVLVAAPFSGAHINPAVTIGLAFAGKFDWVTVPIYLLGQVIGAAAGSLLLWLSYKDHFKITEDLDAKLATFCTGPAVRNSISNFITEAIGTFVLVFSVLYITSPSLSGHTLVDGVAIGLGSLGAVPVALIVVVIGMSLGGPTGYAINPVRDLVPRIMHGLLPLGEKRDGDWGYAMIPVLGPIVGGIIAAGLYLMI